MGHTDTLNQHSSYTNSRQHVPDTICTILSFVTEQNRGFVLPPALLDAYSTFATPWTYEWATVTEYIQRLREWIVCGPESFVVAICLMRRLEELGVVPPCTQRSVHRTFFVCLVLAVKYLEDETLSNTDFAKVGCVTVQELNQMEQHACIALRFNCTVTAVEFETCELELIQVQQLVESKSISVANGQFLSLSDFFGRQTQSPEKKDRKRWSLGRGLRNSAKKTASLILPRKSNIVDENDTCNTNTASPPPRKTQKSKSVAAISRSKPAYVAQPIPSSNVAVTKIHRSNSKAAQTATPIKSGHNDRIRRTLSKKKVVKPRASSRTAKATPVFIIRQDSL